jgi:hypothetical protein
MPDEKSQSHGESAPIGRAPLSAEVAPAYGSVTTACRNRLDSRCVEAYASKDNGIALHVWTCVPGSGNQLLMWY